MDDIDLNRHVAIAMGAYDEYVRNRVLYDDPVLDFGDWLRLPSFNYAAPSRQITMLQALWTSVSATLTWSNGNFSIKSKNFTYSDHKLEKVIARTYLHIKNGDKNAIY